MAAVVIAAASAVATATALNGTPAADRIAGFTNRMYDIVRKVLTPPSASTRVLLPRSRIRKRRSIMFSRVVATASTDGKVKRRYAGRRHALGDLPSRIARRSG